MPVLRPWLSLVALLASACVSTPPPAASRDADLPESDANDCDRDGDGWSRAGCTTGARIDCDDTNASIHPGALETEGSDNDCQVGSVDSADLLAGFRVSNAGNLVGWATDSYTLRFNPDYNFAPTELRLLGSNLLYTDTLPEKFMGVQIWNEWFSWQRQESPDAETEIEAGPAVVRVRIDWNSGSSSQMTGSSIYTLHPDGRIHRDESFSVSEDPEGGQFVVGYVALHPDRFTNVHSGSGAEYATGNPQGSFFQPQDTNSDYLCAFNDANGERIGWSVRAERADSSGGIRGTESELGGFSHQLALQFDWRYSEPDPRGSYAGNFVVHAGLTNTDAPCSELDAIDAAFQRPALLGPQEQIASGGEGDDDSDGYSEGGGFYTVDARGAQNLALEVDATGRNLPPSFTLRVQGMSLQHGAVVEMGGALLVHGRDYLLQAADDGGWIYIALPMSPEGLQVLVP